MSENWFVQAIDREPIFYSTQSEALSAASLLIEKSFDGLCWEQGINSIKVGYITHHVIEENRVDRPENLDDNDCDTEGNRWGCLLYKSKYRLTPTEF